MQNQPDTPLWTKLAATGVAVCLIIAVVIFRHRIGADFWPLDSSRVGPNLVASILTWAAIFTASVLVYPPWRRRLHRLLDSKLAPLHGKLDRHHESMQELHRQMEQLHKSHAKLHEKLDALQNDKD